MKQRALQCEVAGPQMPEAQRREARETSAGGGEQGSGEQPQLAVRGPAGHSAITWIAGHVHPQHVLRPPAAATGTVVASLLN